MDESLDDIRALIRQQQCETEAVAPGKDRDPLRVDAPCADPSDVPPNEFLTAPGAVAAPLPRARLPLGIIVRNRRTSVSCDSGMHGDPGVVDSGELTDSVFLDAVAGMPAGEVARLAGMIHLLQQYVDDTLHALMDNEVSELLFDSGLASVALLELPVAAILRVALVTTAESLDASAVLAAEFRRSCAYRSAQLWVICDASESSGYRVSLTEPEDEGVGNSAFSAEGERTSLVSQADADYLATNDAAAFLVCRYGNAAVRITCADLDARFGGSLIYPVAVGEESYTTLEALHLAGYTPQTVDAPSGGPPLVYAVEVTAGAYFGGTQATANEAAYNHARSLLSCYFPSPALTVDCVSHPRHNDVALRLAAYADHGGNPWADAIDTDSKARTALMNELATGRFDTAPDGGYSENHVIEDGVADVDPAMVVISPPGAFLSVVSQAEAAAVAEAYAVTLLSCAWRSPAASCACDSATSEPGDTLQFAPEIFEALSTPVVLNATLSASRNDIPAGFLTDQSFPSPDFGSAYPWQDTMVALCFSGLVCTYCNSAIAAQCVEAENQTSGLLAGTVCERDPRLTATLAAVTASITKQPETEAGIVCLYTNDEVTYTCVNWASDHAGEDWDDAWGTPASHLSAATVSNYVTAPAGMYPAASKEAANLIAATYVRSALFCQFTNEEKSITCVQWAETKLPGSAVNLAPWSKRHAPFVVPADQYFSSNYGLVKQVAETFLQSQVDCEYSTHYYLGEDTSDGSGAYDNLHDFFCGSGPSSTPPDGDGKIGGTYVSPGSIGFKANTGYPGVSDAPLRDFDLRQAVSRDDFATAKALLYAQVLPQLRCIFRACRVIECPARHDYRPTRVDGSPNVGPSYTRIPGSGTGQRSLWHWFTPPERPNTYTMEGLVDPDYVGRTPPAESVFGGPLPPHPSLSTVAPFAVAVGESTVSMAAAIKTAQTMARSQVQCIYTNWSRSGLFCSYGSKAAVSTPPSVTAGEVTGATTLTADMVAEQLAISYLQCEEDTTITGGGSEFTPMPAPSTPFGAYSSPDTKCCKVDIRRDTASGAQYTSIETALYSPAQITQSGSPDGYSSVSLEYSGLPTCKRPAFIYLEALPHYDPGQKHPYKWTATAGVVKVYSSKQNEREGEHPNYTKVRRLIAEVKSRSSREDCKDIDIVQSVSTAQKLSISYISGRYVPVITDMDTATITERFPSFTPYDFSGSSGAWKCKIDTCYVLGIDPSVGSSVMQYITVSGSGAEELSIAPGKTLYCRVKTSNMDMPAFAQFEVLDSAPKSVHAQPENDGSEGSTDTPEEGDYYYRVATFVAEGDVLRVDEQYHSGGPIIHRPGRNSRDGAKMFVDCDGNEIARMKWKQGIVISSGDADVESGCDNDSASAYEGDG